MTTKYDAIKDRGNSSIWLELPTHTKEEDNQKQVREVNKLLKMLGIDSCRFGRLRGEYVLHSNQGDYSVLADNGYWFNLSYITRDEVAELTYKEL